MSDIAPFRVLLPDEYLAVTGLGVAQWGYFEAQFDAKLQMLGWSPTGAEAQKGEPKKIKFSTRVKLMKKTAVACFPDAPTFVAKIQALCDRASHLAGRRNILVHGLWFDAFDQVTISTHWDGSDEHYTVDHADIGRLAGKIGQLHSDWAFTFPPPGIASPLLTSAETLVWQDFQSIHRPTDLPPQRSRRRRTQPFRA